MMTWVIYGDSSASDRRARAPGNEEGGSWLKLWRPTGRRVLHTFIHVQDDEARRGGFHRNKVVGIDVLRE